MPILTFVHCPSSLGSACVEHKDSFYFERPDNYFNEITHNGILFFLCILGIVTIATFNMAGVSVTKYVSSVARFYIYIYIYIYIHIIFRSVVDVTRTVIVWLVGLIVTFSSDNQWENTLWYAILLEFIGFVILVIGNLVYNKIVILPIPSLYRENYSKIFLYLLTIKNIKFLQIFISE
jgi:hypothetical protein